jgi:hypothetical protein
MWGIFSIRAKSVASGAISVLALSFGAPLLGSASAASAFSDIQIGEMQDIVSKHRSAFGGLIGDPTSKVVRIYLAESTDASARAAGLQALGLVGSSRDPQLGSGPKNWTLLYVAEGRSLIRAT